MLRALLLQVLYTLRSERVLMEELDYNLLFRWFVGLSMDDPVWHPTTFTKNRDRLLDGEVAAAFFDAAGRQARAAGSALRRALHGGRHATGGLGEPEELPPAPRAGEPAGGRPRQSHGQFPR